ncbi:ABC transporter ATP-binding protein/permease [Paratractidigestivibacter sp.]|uniref:ABC transporter ATP-binding protein/permease n=1 Tax=Paratractidigestivibacter sp. TaxID=2847316 RepID=UPI002ACB080B|nr:ABC transporter ATP-binding protein/permease [Paratractidigestivibacter sp.]
MMDKRLLELVPEAMRYVVATVAFQWVGLLGNMALVWSIAQALAAAATGSAVPAAVLYLLFIGIAARVIATRFQATASFMASRDVKRTLRRRIYEKLLRLGPNYTELVPTAEVVQLSVEGCEQLETYFGQYLPQLFYAVLAPVTLFFAVAPVSLPAAIVLLVCVPLIPVTIVAVQKVAKRILGSYWDQYAELGDSFLENLQGLTTLKIYQADAARHAAMNAEAERFRVVTMKVLTMQLNSIIVMDIVALGGAVAGMAVALAATAAGAVDLFGCLFIILLSADFFLPMRQLGSYFHVAMNGMAAADKIFNLLALPEPEARPLGTERGDHFAMTRASFAYEPGRPVLRNVSLDVPSVGLTAIVGESGSGKSTIASLLAGRYDGYAGSVFLGGKQVRDIDRAALARYVTVVGIGAHLFAGTVRDNMLMAAPDASDQDIWGALAFARLADFLGEQDGLETRLEQNGENLSGGQRQRLALARAILANSPVYVFDEATSNIDVESEEAIMEAVRELARYKAVVVISHRLANVTFANTIYVLDGGSVVGSGTHEELLGRCATYQHLWSTQSALEAVTKKTTEAAPMPAAADESEVSADA